MRFTLLVVLVLAVGVVLAGSVSSQTHFIAVIDAVQEVPPSGSPGTGLGCFTLNADNTLDYQVSYNNLLAPEIAAHIHGPAPIGVNAGVQFPFPLGTPKIGTVGPLTAVQAIDLSSGLYYVNIHTSLFPGGEIRGQILTSGTPCTVPTENSTWGAIKALYDEF